MTGSSGSTRLLSPPGAGPVRVRQLEAGEEVIWRAFVDSHPAATPFHDPGWLAAVEEAFGHSVYRLVAERQGRITGVLPLVLLPGRGLGRPFGRRLVSVAFGTEGGVLAADADSADALLAAAEALAVELAAALELRAPPPARAGWTAGPDLYCGFVRELPEDPDRLLAWMPRSRRPGLRRAQERGLEAVFTRDVKAFWPLYAANVHRLGTPAFPRRWFEALLRRLEERADVLLILHRDQPVAGVLTLWHRDSCMPYYAGGSVESRRLEAHDFMYASLMRRAIERGFCRFDFGRSKRGTGSFAYKCLWRFEPRPLTYGFFVPGGGRPPEVNPLNPRYRFFVEGWKRLPRPLADRLGPLLSRHLG